MKKILITTLAILLTQTAFAKQVTCPPADVVRAIQFSRSLDYDSSIDLWELLSAPFEHDGVMWDIAFGTEFPGIKTGDAALKEANRVYKNYPLVNENPEAIDIGSHVFCDYTHEGMMYWIQAMTPPGE